MEVDATYLERLRVTAQNRGRKKQAKAIDDDGNGFGQSDDDLSFIIGYTSGGMPYGVPWPDDEIAPQATNQPPKFGM